jgi:hypothetical protein
LEPGGIPLAIERFVVMENIEGRALETGEHAQHSPAVFGVFFHERIFIWIETARFSEDGIRDAHFTDVVQERGNLEILKLGFFEAQFLADAHTPFRQPGAVYAGIQILEIEELVKGADDGSAKRGSLFLKLLDAERLQRPRSRGALHGRWNLAVGHWRYQQSKKQLPEPPEPEVEPELFTQAETA